MEPNFYHVHILLGMTYEQTGEFSKAIAELETALQLNDDSFNLAYLGHAYAVAGMADEARKVLDKLKARLERGNYVPSYTMALMYTGLGDKNQAFEWL